MKLQAVALWVVHVRVNKLRCAEHNLGTVLVYDLPHILRICTSLPLCPPPRMKICLGARPPTNFQHILPDFQTPPEKKKHPKHIKLLFLSKTDVHGTHVQLVSAGIALFMEGSLDPCERGRVGPFACGSWTHPCFCGLNSATPINPSQVKKLRCAEHDLAAVFIQQIFSWPVSVRGA